MDWYLFCLNSVSLAGQGILHLFFVCRFTDKLLKLPHIVLYLIFLHAIEAAAAFAGFGSYTVLNGSTDELRQGLLSAAAIAAEFALLFAVCRFLLKNSRALSLIASLLALYAGQLSFGIINSLEALLFENFLGRPILYVLAALATAASLCLCAGCYLLILRWFAFRKGQESPHIWILLPSCLFFFAAERFILYTSYTHLVFPVSAEPGRHLILLALQVLGIAALLSTLFAYERTCREFYAQAALSSMARELSAQRTYVAQAQMHYEKTRSFRHDVKNHLSVLDGLLKAGNTAQAEVYLQKLETVTADLSFPFHTGNPVVDIVLSDKLELARSGGIKTEVSLTFPKNCRADDLDLCVIFANALDNAIHACGKVGENPFIRITGSGQGDFHMLEFENTCLPGPLPKWGTGLSNIKAVAEKYGGAITAEQADSCFRLSVLLNISIHPEPPSGQKP